MNQDKLNFESENLVVDWISFNITGLTDPNKIAVYLSESFSFNSVLKQTSKGKSASLILKPENKNKVVFVKHTYNSKSNSYWSGVVVRFTG